jgi:hypothetical protein
MLYNKIIAVHSVNQVKHINTLRGQIKSFNFKAVVMYIFHRTFKGKNT